MTRGKRPLPQLRAAGDSSQQQMEGHTRRARQRGTPGNRTRARSYAHTSCRGAVVKTVAARHLRTQAEEELLQGLRWQQLLQAPAAQEQLQGLRWQQPLRAPAAEEPLQRLWRQRHLRTQAAEEPLQRLWRQRAMRTQQDQEQLQGLWRQRFPLRLQRFSLCSGAACWHAVGTR